MDFTVCLNQGINTINFTSIEEDGGPNIDQIKIDDLTSTMDRAKRRAQEQIVFNPSAYSLSAGVTNASVKISLFTVDGRLVHYQEFSRVTGDASFILPRHKLQSGSYLLRAVVNGREHVMKTIFIR